MKDKKRKSWRKWITKVTGCAVPDEAADTCRMLTDATRAWPDRSVHDDVREIARDLQSLFVRLREVTHQTTGGAHEDSPEAIYSLATSSLADLVDRMCSRNDTPSPTELAELKALRSAIRVFLEPSDANEDRYLTDNRAYAEALLDQVDTAKTINARPRIGPRGIPIRKTIRQEQPEIDRLVGEFEAYFAEVADNSTLLAAAVRAIDTLSPPREKDSVEYTAVERMAVELSANLGAMANQKLSKIPQLSRTHTERTANDILVHAMALARKVAKDHPHDTDLQSLRKSGRMMFMEHNVDLNKILAAAKSALQRLDADAATTLAVLQTQLPTNGKLQPRTQLHDNIYGRVFESKFFAALVQKVPQQFLDDCLEIGRGFCTLFDNGDGENVAAAVEAASNYEVPRAWSRQVPAMGDLAKLGSEESEGLHQPGETLDAAKTILLARPQSGQEMIARFRLMMDLSDETTRRRRATFKRDPEWMERASAMYEELIIPQRPYDRSWIPGGHPESDAVGITLSHHPTAARDPLPIISARPSALHRFGKRKENIDLDKIEIPLAMRTSHEKGIPLTAGVSGTTNVMLHLFSYLKEKGAISHDISASNFLFMAALFVGYEGGHSLHEALWVGNLLDEQLGLDLSLGKAGDDPNGFVANYDAFLSKFDGDVAISVNSAADEAWDGTLDYLEQHSAFAKAG
ncbi:hypothetical protein ACI2KT_35855 [Ensifer adhaerens]|uniref:hypothetical protein n=1 Tax=Ensifer adhaerens TaxID=106592 RepID=UPI00384C5459